MKTIKILSVMLCLVASMSFVSCGDDDNGPGDGGTSIVGEWEYEDDGCREWYKFDADGSFSYEYEDDYDFDYEYGTYEYKENRLIIFVGDEVEVYSVLSLTESQLVIENDYGDRCTFYRVD